VADELAYFVDWYPNKPVELKRDKVYRLGRGGGNEFFLPDYHASRVHAELRWNGSAFVLKDLNSSNGTFVNGEQVTERELKPGDEIQIGSHVLRLRAESPARVAEEFERQCREVQEWQTVISRRPAEGGLSGTIKDVRLSEVLQVLESGRKTGRLSIASAGAEGSIYVKDGRVVAADFSTTDGSRTLADHEAVYSMLALDEGVFEFFGEDVSFEPRIRESTQSLLIEGMRRLDEMRRAEGFPAGGADTQRC